MAIYDMKTCWTACLPSEEMWNQRRCCKCLVVHGIESYAVLQAVYQQPGAQHRTGPVQLCLRKSLLDAITDVKLRIWVRQVLEDVVIYLIIGAFAQV